MLAYFFVATMIIQVVFMNQLVGILGEGYGEKMAVKE